MFFSRRSRIWSCVMTGESPSAPAGHRTETIRQRGDKPYSQCFGYLVGFLKVAKHNGNESSARY